MTTIARTSVKAPWALDSPKPVAIISRQNVAFRTAPGSRCCRATHRRSRALETPVVRRDCRTSAAAAGAKPAEAWWKKDDAPNMRDVTSIQDMVDQLADAGDKLVIVEFYAPWCNACKALYPKLCKMMREHEEDVLFLKVSFEDNKDMCKTMGIKVLPYFHFYRGAEGKVDQFSCTVSKIQKMKDAIVDYTSPFCSLEEPPGVAEFPEVHTSGEHHHPDADIITRLAWH